MIVDHFQPARQPTTRLNPGRHLFTSQRETTSQPFTLACTGVCAADIWSRAGSRQAAPINTAPPTATRNWVIQLANFTQLSTAVSPSLPLSHTHTHTHTQLRWENQLYISSCYWSRGVLVNLTSLLDLLTSHRVNGNCQHISDNIKVNIARGRHIRYSRKD